MAALNALDTARTLLLDLIDGGVRDAVLAAGSRSAPFAYALAELEARGLIRVHVRADERVAGFTALGLSLATHRPVPVMTTSGTAVGELLPAVMEAAHAGVRLLVLSADRPEELRGTGANQTTRQAGLYPLHARASIELEAEPEDAHVVAEAVRAALAAAAGTATDPAGPVQLNVSFRDPLAPAPGWAADGSDLSPALAERLRRTAEAHPDGVLDAVVVEDTSSDQGGPEAGRRAQAQVPARAAGEGQNAGETATDVAGPELAVSAEPRNTAVLAGHGAGEQAAFFAARLGLPLLAEPSSNARFGPSAIQAPRLVLGEFAERVERVVVFGRPTLSRPLARLMARTDVERLLYAPQPPAWFEQRRRTDRLVTDLAELERAAGPAPEGWLAAWQEAGADAEAAIHGLLASEEEHVSGLHVADAVWEASDGNLVLGASNPIRDVDLVASPGWHPIDVYANRGLAGIDGTVSTALGIALGSGIPSRVLVGDVTFLHDAGALQSAPGEARPDLQIVVLNDGGGRIFGLLDHGAVGRDNAAAGSVVERFFATPHTVDIAALCRAYGVEHREVRHAEELFEALDGQPRGVSVVEVRVDAERAADMNGAVLEALA